MGSDGTERDPNAQVGGGGATARDWVERRGTRDGRGIRLVVQDKEFVDTDYVNVTLRWLNSRWGAQAWPTRLRSLVTPPVSPANHRRMVVVERDG